MDFLSTMKAKAKADKKVIVLPESYEKRTRGKKGSAQNPEGRTGRYHSDW